MALQPQPLPDDVPARPIGRSAAFRLGITDRELSTALWTPAVRGSYIWSQVDSDPAMRIKAVAEVLPVHGCITGWAALFIAGVSWLDGLATDGRHPLPVPVTMPYEAGMRPRRGIQVIRSQLADDDFTLVDGVPVTLPVRAAFDAARLPAIRERRWCLTEAVVALDAAVAFGTIQPYRLAEYIGERPRWRGRQLASNALSICDGRVRSPWESRYRVLWVSEAELPRPDVNVPVYRDTGELLGYPDLLEPEVGLVGEYDGEVHREPIRHAADNVREEAFESSGLVVTRAGAHDLRVDRAVTIDRLLDGYRRARTQDKALRRWTLRPTD